MISSDNCRWATETLSEYIETYSYIQTKYIEPLGTSIWGKKYKEYIVDTKSLASDDIKKAEKRHKEQQLSIIEKTFKYHTWDLEAWNIKDIRMFILTKAHLYSYENESWKKSFDSIDYTVLFSFGNYLEQNYGYDNFLRIMLSKEDLKNITEKTEEELRNDWGQYLIDTYSYLYYE